ncbi:MAG: class I SAM-dependent methyltransferase [Myxococcota bacterium]
MTRSLARFGSRERSVTLANAAPVSVLEARDLDGLLDDAIATQAPAPYGAVLWASGVAVAEVLASRQLTDMRVLDVGAGVGLCALVAARGGAAVTALDHDENARALLEEAARRQQLVLSCVSFDLFDEVPLPPADLVVFADLLYEAPLAVVVARRVDEALRRGSAVLVGDPGRVGRPAFLQTLAALGRSVTFQDRWVRLPDEPELHRVGLMELSP